VTIKTFGVGALALAFVAPAAPAQNAPAKVAIINIQSAIIATKDGEKARNDMQTKLGPKAKDLEARNAEIVKLRDALQKGANTQSQEQREKLQREIDDKGKRLQWDNEDLNNEAKQEEEKIVNAIGNRMLVVIDKYAKEKGISLVLDVSTQASPVLWAADGIDISRDIVERYDKEYGTNPLSPGGAAPGPAALPSAAPAAPAPKPATPTKK